MLQGRNPVPDDGGVNHMDDNPVPEVVVPDDGVVDDMDEGLPDLISGIKKLNEYI